MLTPDTFTAIVVLLLLTLMFIPSIPMLLAMRHPEDIFPLKMDLDYSVDPKFQANFFEYKFNKAPKKFFHIIDIKDTNRLKSCPKDFNQQKPTVYISKDSIVKISSQISCSAILYAPEGIIIKGVDIYALKSNKKIIIDKYSIVRGWVDTSDILIIFKNTKLHLATANRIFLHQGVTFYRLWAEKEIVTKTTKDKVYLKEELPITNSLIKKSIDENLLLIVDKKYTIPANSIIKQDIVCRGDLYIEENCDIYGTIKCDRELVIDKSVIVRGDIIADGIILKERCTILGNLFSHKETEIYTECQIGTPLAHKSLISVEYLRISINCRIFNYILAYSGGEVV